MFEISAKKGLCYVICGSEVKTSDLAAHFSRNSGAANAVLFTIQTDIWIAIIRYVSLCVQTTGEFKDYRMSSEVQEDDLAYKIHMLEKLESDLLSLQNELTKLGCADESNHLDRLEEEIFKGRRMLTRLESSHSATQAGRDFGQLDLSSPLVKLPSFDGSISGWPEFWELFDITVNRNPKYTDVQRFVILKAHLGALAKPIIEGIPLSDDGYVTALDLLQKRFAKKDQRQEILLKQLMEIPPVKESNDLVKMRGLIDRVTARVSRFPIHPWCMYRQFQHPPTAVAEGEAT